MSVSTEFRDLIKDFEKYKTTNTDFHAGDLIEHSTWAAFYVNDLYTNLDMDNPLHKVWNQQYVDEAQRAGINVDDKKVLILAAFLHDIGKGGDGNTTYYDKPDHEITGATYIDLNSYRDINSNIIDLEKMFNDFGLSELEVNIIKVLVGGHWLIGKVIGKSNSAENFIKEFEKVYKSYISDPDTNLFKLVAMMQLIICIADVMATKKYEGHSTDIDEFPQIPLVTDGQHKPSKYMFEVFKYKTIIAKFVLLVYKYLDKNYNAVSTSTIEQIINNISSISIDFVESSLTSGNKIDETLRDKLIEASVSNKRYDIAIMLFDILGVDTFPTLISELLIDHYTLDDFITYVKGEDKYKKHVQYIFNNIIINNIPEGLTPFLNTHREYLTLSALNLAKNAYMEAEENNHNEFDADLIYREIKGNYKAPDGFYKDEKHKEFCEETVPEKYPEPLVQTTKKTIFKIPTIIRGKFKPEHLSSPKPEKQFELKQLLSYDNYGGQTSSLFGDDFTLDMDWVYSCIDYMKNLSIEDKYTILGYTYNGDEFVNLFLIQNLPKLKSKIDEIKKKGKDKYKNFYFPLFFQLIKIIKDGLAPRYKRLIDTSPITLLDLKNNINNNNLTDTYLYIIKNLEYFTDEFYGVCIKLFANDLKRILDNAPAMTKTSILYRGVKDKYYYSDPSKTTFQTNTFMSTSFNAESAFEFAEKNCCFKKIIAVPGTKGIFMEAITQMGGENEILLNVGTKFNIIDDKDKNFFDIDERQNLDDICSNKNIRTMNITTMEVVI